jgi:hypothetical protein
MPQRKAAMRSSAWTRALSAAGRSLVESTSTQARSLEGRPLAMDFSLMLSERSRLRLLSPRRRRVTGEVQKWKINRL